MKTQEENPNGLHKRYNVTKVSGKPVDEGAEYLVLRLDSAGKDPMHVAAGRKAALCYAEEIKDHLPKLAADIINKYNPSITAESIVGDIRRHLDEIYRDTEYDVTPIMYLPKVMHALAVAILKKDGGDYTPIYDVIVKKRENKTETSFPEEITKTNI